MLWGRCWEAGGAPAYWPWVQALRSYLRDRGEEAVRLEMGRGASDIAQMLPEVRDVIPGLPDPPSLDPEGARFRLFESTSGFLRTASMNRALVLLLDDLHAADTPSLLLLQFVGRDLAGSHMLIVGTYRDVEIHPDHPLSETLAELAREEATRRLHLRGLVERDVALFIQTTTGIQPPASVVRAVYRETEGNPLFVGEIVRLLAAEGLLEESIDPASWRLAIPQGIREVIGRRVSRLSKECGRTLSLASVLGREFGLDPLAALSGLAPDELTEVLDEAATARVVGEVPATPGRLRFAHSLIRETLYDELSPARRARLHLRAGEALETLYAKNPDPHLAELAHHFFQALPGGDMEKAIHHAQRAGDRAVALLAYEEAARLYDMALRALELTERPADAARCDLLLAVGEAWARAGDKPAAKQKLLAAAALARELDLPEHLAQAALGYGGRFVFSAGREDRLLVRLLEEALTALGEGDRRLRVRVLARLAGGPLRDEVDRGRREALSREAVEMAERIEDPETLAYAHAGWFAANWPDDLEERMAAATRVLVAAEEANDKERTAEGHFYRMLTSLERGEAQAAQTELQAHARLAEETRQPAHLWLVATIEAIWALFEGRFSEAERLIPKALDLGLRAETLTAVASFRMQIFWLRLEQRRLHEVEEELDRSILEHASYPTWRCVIPYFFSHLGREPEARRGFEALAANGFTDLPRNEDWIFAMNLLCEVAESLGDGERARVLYDLLLPYADRISVVWLMMGSVSRSLGILASMLARYREAEQHFREALEANQRMKAWPWVAHTQHDHARMLLARDAPGDRERALALLGSCIGTCRDLGMVALEGKVNSLLEEMGQVPVAASRLPEAGASRPSIFRREGEYWSVAFEGDAFRLKDSRGLRYLARLLEAPGRQLHVLELVAAEERPGADGGRGERSQARGVEEEGLGPSGLGDAGEILDEQAKAAYRRRLTDLEEDLAEAESFGDAERAAQAKEEVDFLARELAAAVGLGGRNRVAASSAERARVSVTKAIKAVVRRVKKNSPALGKHLEATIKTGAFCSYSPDPRVPISWHI